MGQYRQWLQHREIDQQLRAQLAQLEQALVDLVEQADLAEDTLSYTQNVIIQALDGQRHTETLPQPILITPSLEHSELVAELSPSPYAGLEQPNETVSHALFGWSQLPNFDAQQGRNADMSKASTIGPLVSSSHAEMDLLPDDMSAFMDNYIQTSPQLELPWWFHSALSQTESSVDQQSVRTNFLVQRWLERWGREPKETTRVQEGQHT